MVGSPRNYMLMADTIREHYPEATWLAHSSTSQTFPLCAIAIATGAHIRVGFEDSPFLPNNRQPTSNAQYIEWAVTMAQLHGAGAGHAATGAGYARADTVPGGVAIMGRQEADAIGLAVARAAQEAAPHATVILFGSRARGDHRPDSDVDLMVIANTDDRMVFTSDSRYCRPGCLPQTAGVPGQVRL